MRETRIQTVTCVRACARSCARILGGGSMNERREEEVTVYGIRAGPEPDYSRK